MQSYMRHLQSVYTIKEPAHPEIYLGALYTGQPSQDWTISCKNYIKEAITRIECQYGTLREKKSPSILEITLSRMIQLYWTMSSTGSINMAQWHVTLGQLDICYAILSLSHFSCCPQEGHIQRLFWVWGYLKEFPNKSICIFAQDPVHEEPLEEFRADFEDQYTVNDFTLISNFLPW